jgi:biotin carboxyl carrier protein
MGSMIGATLLLRIGDRAFSVEVRDGRVLVDGVAVEQASPAWAVVDGHARWVFAGGEVYEFEAQQRGSRSSSQMQRGKRGDGAHHGSLTAPMPATVRKITVVEGMKVAKGATLVVLEAMKMELPVRAPSDGVVTRIACREGDLVQPGITLVEMTEAG